MCRRYILERTRSFIELGTAAWQALQPYFRKHASDTAICSTSSSSSITREAACDGDSGRSVDDDGGGAQDANLNTGSSELGALLCAHHDVGPTLSKMFLVTTHLRYPHFGLLDESCQVRGQSMQGSRCGFLIYIPCYVFG